MPTCYYGHPVSPSQTSTPKCPYGHLMCEKYTPPQGIVKFQLGSARVYINPPADYHDAIKTAQKEFPELRDIPSSRITFNRDGRKLFSRRRVRVAESAWEDFVRDPRLPAGKVHIMVLHGIGGECDDLKAPPKYLEG